MTNPQEVLDHLDEQKRRQRARSQEPVIEVNQRWIAFNREGKVTRRLRILARHPDGGWIVQDEPADVRHRLDYFAMKRTPEFNLRYVFELEP